MKSFIPSGLIFINKPMGFTSHDVVGKVRKILHTKEVGHTGTLDPLASGLMVLIVNEATKLSNYFLEGDKGYTVEFALGVTSDTLDMTGECAFADSIVLQKSLQFSENLLLEKAHELQGEHQVPVPIYSAAKVDGKKLYEYARAGLEVEIPLKPMKFWDVQFLGSFQESMSDGDTNLVKLQSAIPGVRFYRFSLRCSKGSFIRSWVQLLGELLKTGAVMTGLRRTYSEPFQLEQALDLETLLEKVQSYKNSENKNDLDAFLIPLERAMPHMPIVRIEGGSQKLLLNGQISHDLRNALVQKCQSGEIHQYFQVQSGISGRLLAICEFVPEKGFKIKRVFKPAEL